MRLYSQIRKIPEFGMQSPTLFLQKMFTPPERCSPPRIKRSAPQPFPPHHHDGGALPERRLCRSGGTNKSKTVVALALAIAVAFHPNQNKSVILSETTNGSAAEGPAVAFAFVFSVISAGNLLLPSRLPLLFFL
jgi:hypothetical protein